MVCLKDKFSCKVAILPLRVTEKFEIEAKVKFRRLRHTILENSFLLHIIHKLLRSSWVCDKSLKFVTEKLQI